MDHLPIILSVLSLSINVFLVHVVIFSNRLRGPVGPAGMSGKCKCDDTISDDSRRVASKYNAVVSKPVSGYKYDLDEDYPNEKT